MTKLYSSYKYFRFKCTASFRRELFAGITVLHFASSPICYNVLM